MTTAPDKLVSPAYTSYKPLMAWLNSFRDDGHIPMRVDKSHLPKASGSVQAGHLAALKFLRLIDSGGKPTGTFERFVMADDAARPAILAEMLRAAYDFIFTDPEFDLARASSKMLEEKFRGFDIKGSALMRAIAFFLAAAREAGVKLAPGLKAPSAPPRTDRKIPNGLRKLADSDARNDDGVETDDQDEDGGGSASGVLRFEIPIPVNRKVKISIPADFDKDDWDLLQTMFSAYVKRWKAFAANVVKENES